MPDWKEMYLLMFRESEKAKNIIIDAKRQCEEMYINAPEHELQILPKPGEDNARLWVTSMPDYKELFHQLYLETHKAVIVMMEAQIQCDAMSMNSMSTEIMLMSGRDERGLILDKDKQKESRT